MIYAQKRFTARCILEHVTCGRYVLADIQRLFGTHKTVSARQILECEEVPLYDRACILVRLAPHRYTLEEWVDDAFSNHGVLVGWDEDTHENLCGTIPNYENLLRAALKEAIERPVPPALEDD